MKVLFDTNILIDHLHGIGAASAVLASYSDGAISAISWVEVMAGAAEEQDTAVRLWLDGFHLIDIDADIAVYAADLRRDRGLDLADALILATAQASGRTLITRDRGLVHELDDPPVLVPYDLSAPEAEA